jgi:hypothetical protein
MTDANPSKYALSDVVISVLAFLGEIRQPSQTVAVMLCCCAVNIEATDLIVKAAPFPVCTVCACVWSRSHVETWHTHTQRCAFNGVLIVVSVLLIVVSVCAHV